MFPYYLAAAAEARHAEILEDAAIRRRARSATAAWPHDLPHRRGHWRRRLFAAYAGATHRMPRGGSAAPCTSC